MQPQGPTHLPHFFPTCSNPPTPVVVALLPTLLLFNTAHSLPYHPLTITSGANLWSTMKDVDLDLYTLYSNCYFASSNPSKTIPLVNIPPTFSTPLIYTTSGSLISNPIETITSVVRLSLPLFPRYLSIQPLVALLPTLLIFTPAHGLPYHPLTDTITSENSGANLWFTKKDVDLELRAVVWSCNQVTEAGVKYSNMCDAINGAVGLSHLGSWLHICRA